MNKTLRGLICLGLILWTSAASALQLGQVVPDFSMLTIRQNGTSEKANILEHTLGNEPLVLVFFQTGCGYCIDELPTMSALAQEFQNRATVRYIAIDRREVAVRDFIQQYQALIRFDVALDGNREAFRAYGGTGTPTTLVISRNNELLLEQVGTFSAAELESLRDLLRANL